jgi:hypothetical protein
LMMSQFAVLKSAGDTQNDKIQTVAPSKCP